MESQDFYHILTESIKTTMESDTLQQKLSVLAPLASHAHNSPREIDRFFLEKICHSITQKMTAYFSGHRKLFLLPLPNKEGTSVLRALLYWQKDPPIPVGELLLQVFAEESELIVQFQVEIPDLEGQTFHYPLSPHLQRLQAPQNKKKLPRFDPEQQQLVFIDLEWVSCYKGRGESSQVELGQISEFSFSTDNFFYTSGYLKVSPMYLKRMHKKLLDKMGISIELMQERHKEGKYFLEEWNRVFLPILENTEKTVVLLSYGTEDSKIFHKLFQPAQQKRIKLIDVSGFYDIFNFGQMALLNGLGVIFTHDFSSDMDVRALVLINQVFSQCETVEDSRNLQLALQLHKMYLKSEEDQDKIKLKIYLSYVLNQEKTKILFEDAVRLAKSMVDDGLFIKKQDS